MRQANLQKQIENWNCALRKGISLHPTRQGCRSSIIAWLRSNSNLATVVLANFPTFNLFWCLFFLICGFSFIHAKEVISRDPKPKESRLDIFTDFLYWHATENTSWAIKLKASSPNAETVSLNTVNFGWHPAFRVGLGLKMDHDEWDTQFIYTHFDTTATHQLEGSMLQSSFLGSRAWGLSPYTFGKIRMDIDYNVLDWTLGRYFLTSKKLSVRPFVGVKGGWIYQSLHTQWENPQFEVLFTSLFLKTKENLHCNFSGVGPEAGANLEWIFANLKSHSFSLCANFAAAYLWGHWSIKDKLKDNYGLTTLTKVAPRNFGAFALQALIGMGWGFNFNKDLTRFSLKVGYEFQDWFNQYQIFDDTTGGNNNDLQLQGLTVDARIDF